MGRKRRPLPIGLPSKLRQLRLRLGLSEERMAEALSSEDFGLCARDVASFERGRSEPPLAVLLGYARAAFVPLEAIVDDTLMLPDVAPARDNAPEGQCPYCGDTRRQLRNGRNGTGSQRYLCGRCERRYTHRPRRNGHPPGVRLRAVTLCQGGMKPKDVAREVGVSPQTVVNWVNAYRARGGVRAEGLGPADGA